MAAEYKFITKHGHPNAKVNGQIAEHIYIMSEMLGRPLAEGEVVHHCDENKRNNAPKNLQLFTSIAEHLLHHAHLRAMLDCGNPSYMRCVYCKTYDDPLKMVVSPVKHRAFHKECASANSKARNATPEGKLKARARTLKRRATPEGRAEANMAAVTYRAKRKLSLNSN